MDKEQVLKSNSLKKRFCKDASIPITVYAEPYFTERLIELEPIYNSYTLFDEFCAMLTNFNSEQEYFEYYNQVKENMINAVKTSDYYEDYSNGKRFIPSLKKNNFSKRNLYIEENDNNFFISIDIAKANYTIMKTLCPDVMCNSYEEFIGQFTEYEYIKKSKYIRQVVFGALNPKRQVKSEENLMSLMTSVLTSVGLLDIYSVNSDEIIIKTESYLVGVAAYNRIKKFIETAYPDITFHINLFRLKFAKIGYVKYILGSPFSEIELKCFDAETIHQVVNYYYGRPITENDLVFYHNGKLARYLEPIENPWSE